MPHQQLVFPFQQIHRKKIRAARHPIPPVVRHAFSVIRRADEVQPLSAIVGRTQAGSDYVKPRDFDASRSRIGTGQHTADNAALIRLTGYGLGAIVTIGIYRIFLRGIEFRSNISIFPFRYLLIDIY